MLAAGSLSGEVDEGGSSDKQNQQSHYDSGHYAAFQGAQVIGALHGKALLEEQGADEDADNEADQTNDGVQVAAADTDHHTQRAAQEHQGADHNEHTQYKAQGRGGTAAAFEFLKAKSSDEGTQYNADDLGADVLDHACGVQAQGTGGIPQEARNTEAHVAGVAQRSQQYGSSAYHQTGRHDQPVYFFHGINLSLS